MQHPVPTLGFSNQSFHSLLSPSAQAQQVKSELPTSPSSWAVAEWSSLCSDITAFVALSPLQFRFPKFPVVRGDRYANYIFNPSIDKDCNIPDPPTVPESQKEIRNLGSNWKWIPWRWQSECEVAMLASYQNLHKAQKELAVVRKFWEIFFQNGAALSFGVLALCIITQYSSYFEDFTGAVFTWPIIGIAYFVSGLMTLTFGVQFIQAIGKRLFLREQAVISNFDNSFLKFNENLLNELECTQRMQTKMSTRLDELQKAEWSYTDPSLNSEVIENFQQIKKAMDQTMFLLDISAADLNDKAKSKIASIKQYNSILNNQITQLNNQIEKALARKVQSIKINHELARVQQKELELKRLQEIMNMEEVKS